MTNGCMFWALGTPGLGKGINTPPVGACTAWMQAGRMGRMGRMGPGLPGARLATDRRMMGIGVADDGC